MGLIFKWPSKQCSSVLPGSGDTSLQFSFLHTLRDKKHRDRILVKILLNLRTTLYDLLESTWCWFRGCRMVTMRWARRQVSKEKRENRWSQTEIEKWARSQGCCSAGNLDDCEVVDIWKIYFEELGKVGSCVATNLIWWVGYQCCHSYLTSISGDGAEWIAWSWTRERIKSERASKPRRGEVWQLFGFLWFQYLITN